MRLLNIFFQINVTDSNPYNDIFLYFFLDLMEAYNSLLKSILRDVPKIIFLGSRLYLPLDTCTESFMFNCCRAQNWPFGYLTRSCLVDDYSILKTFTFYVAMIPT